MKTTSIRLEEAQDNDIEAYANRMKIDKSAAARQIIDKGLKAIKTKEALENVRTHKWTIWKAASYCGESYRSFLKLLRYENIPFPLSAEELKRELDDSSSE